MVDAQLEFGDVYVTYDDMATVGGFAEGILSVRQSAIDRDKESIWINFGDNLGVCLKPMAMDVLLAKIKKIREEKA